MPPNAAAKPTERQRVSELVRSHCVSFSLTLEPRLEQPNTWHWIAQSVLDACVARDHSCAMGDVKDFHRDFLPRFIDAQRAFHDGDPEPNNALWSTTDPVSLFAARGLSGIGTEDVTKTFRFVAAWFSTYAATRGSSSSPTCAGTSPTRWPSSATQHRARAALRPRPRSGSPTSIVERPDSGGRCTAMRTSCNPTKRRLHGEQPSAASHHDS
jgi:hypothetical protein